MNRTALTNKNVLAGLFFIAVAVVFGISASALPMGTFGRMGPGYMPIILASLLGLLGALLVVRSFMTEVAGPDTTPAKPPLRAIVLILGAAFAFAVTVKPLGFLPATIITLLLTIAAGNRLNIVGAFVLTAVLTASSWAVFILGLNLHWPLLGTWFR